MQYVTRIAPSPTGDMHVGTARTAYFNWLAARASKGKFIMRIDDTDQSRNKPEYVDVIIQTMQWLGLDYDSLIFQSSNFAYYRQVADTLVDSGRAYKKDGCTLWLSSLDKDFPKTWTDQVAGEISITNDDISRMSDMVLIKSDGSPTYNWASILDDAKYGVNYIIRGTDHITNTSRQVILWSVLGYAIPKFAHIGLIGVNGKPLSKRDGAASMLHYRDRGYDRDAVLNFLARLGWGPKKDDKTTAVLTRDKMLSLFLNDGNLKSNLANMDMVKLDSYDRKYKAMKGATK